MAVTSSFHLLSDFIENFDDTLVFEAHTTMFVCITVFVLFAFFGNTFSTGGNTFACSRFAFLTWPAEFFSAVSVVTAFK